jgi:MerR family transcriptional regulator, thiopeptide resistance regulator
VDGEAMFAVGEVAEMTGVSVRALHHYDEIGLLSPRREQGSGHRRYGPSELLRLHRILTYRELGLELAAIADVLDNDEHDPIEALRTQRAAVRDDIVRLGQIVAAIDRYLTLWELGYRLSPADYREVFGDFDPRPLLEHIREPDDPERRAGQQQRWEQLSKEDWARFMTGSDQLYRQFARLLEDGVPPDDTRARHLAEEHRSHAEAFSGTFTYADQREMADLLVVEPGRSNVDAYGDGLADYIHAAIHANSQDATSGEPA